MMRRIKVKAVLSGGVTVAQGPLEAFVLVRIQAGQPGDGGQLFRLDLPALVRPSQMALLKKTRIPKPEIRKKSE